MTLEPLVFRQEFGMSMIIGSAAFFRVNERDEFGSIVLAGGADESVNLCSKETALQAMDTGVKDGRISKYEIPGLREQIMKSSLPRHEKDANILVRLRAELTLFKDLLEVINSRDDDTPPQRVQ